MVAANVSKFAGAPHMPLQLKSTLLRHGLRQSQLCAAVVQRDGRRVSPTAMSHLINFGNWPKTTEEKSIREQVVAFLRAQSIPEDEIGCIWDIDRENKARGLHLASPHFSDIEPLEVVMLSPAAKKHFKIFRDPFKDEVAGPDDVFLSSDQRYVSEAMYQVVRHGGFLAVVGESGSGKSTLRKMLIERIVDQPIRLIFPRVIDKARLTTGNICQAIINDLAPGETVRASPEGQARQVEKLLKSSSHADNMHFLLIEEAHDLSIQTLKYLKRFYELEDGFKKLLSIILVGQPELREKLDERRHPEAREVIRRIEIAELAPLDGHLQDYVVHKFKRAGVDAGTVFDTQAFDAIRLRLTHTRPGSREVQSQLYPLVVNNLVTKAMNRAADLGVPLITADLVKEI